MSANTHASEFFVAGGTLRPNTPSYVERPTDDELFNRALNGEFCYVLTPRQMGKSSLMIRTARRLGEHGVQTVIIDLTRIGADVKVEQWYLSLLTQIKRRLRLSVDPLAWWHERAALGHIQRFTDFLRDAILTEIEEKVVIFIDEIDTTLNLDFRDDFFAAIRAMYNARAEDPEFDRLTFVLLGVASPPDLIKDRARTPFNIGYGIALQEFSQTDAAVLRDGLETAHPGQGETIFARIYHWTNGHPYLTQKLCLAVAEARDEHWTNKRVDELVEKLFLSGEARKEANLKFVQDKILTHPQHDELLELYKKVVKRKRVGDDGQSPIQNQLKLSGLVKVENGRLRIRNEIYRRNFDSTWVKENTRVNWIPILAGIAGGAVVVALLAVGLIAYNGYVDLQVREAIASFPTSDSKGRLDRLAEIFQSQPFLLGPTGYDDKARVLFFGLSREEQLALFKADDVKDSNLVKVIKGLYMTLADVDGIGSTTPLLEAMVSALDRLDEAEETTRLRDEIDNWLQGRGLAKQNQYNDALVEYNRAIEELNGENPATRYERAKILTELSKYLEALSDLDQVIAGAGSASPSTSTPPPSTDTPTLISSPPVVASTPPPVSTTESDLTPSTNTPSTGTPPASVTATPTPQPTSTETPTPTSGSFISEFADSGEVQIAVRNLIYSNPGLISSLASNSSLEEYPNLRKFILIPTPTPTATPTVEVIPTISLVAATLAVPTTTVPDTPTPPSPTLVPITDRKIAFFSERDGNYKIYSVRLDGSDPVELTANAFDNSDPACAPNGRHIAFQSNQDGNYDIYTLDLENGQTKRLTNDAFDNVEPAWSPDERYLTFGSLRNGNTDIYRIQSDGSELIRLTNDPAHDIDPAWSPDGTQIAFSSERDGNPEIYIMRADGTETIRLTDNPAVDLEPAWSPDGSALAFFSDRDGDREIYVLHLATMVITQLTHNTAIDSVPEWSQDGQWIAFETDRDGNHEIYVMSADGAHTTRVTNHPSRDSGPCWMNISR